MFRYLSQYVADLSDDPKLKLTLAWMTFAMLVVPTAILMSLGVSAKAALITMSILVLPLHYALYVAFFAARETNSLWIDLPPIPSFVDSLEIQPNTRKVRRKKDLLYVMIGSPSDSIQRPYSPLIQFQRLSLTDEIEEVGLRSVWSVTYCLPQHRA